jgi:hypothetical protein
MPRGVASTQRAMAGSVAPINSVGGNRAITQKTARRNKPGMPSSEIVL